MDSQELRREMEMGIVEYSEEQFYSQSVTGRDIRVQPDPEDVDGNRLITFDVASHDPYTFKSDVFTLDRETAIRLGSWLLEVTK